MSSSVPVLGVELVGAVGGVLREVGVLQHLVQLGFEVARVVHKRVEFLPKYNVTSVKPAAYYIVSMTLEDNKTISN